MSFSDPSQCYDQSWHDGTFYPSDYNSTNHAEAPGGNHGQIMWANVTFSGTAVYVYTILAHTSNSPDGASDMTFFIDGEKVGSFAQQPDNSTEYTYNALVYHNTNLSAQSHDLSIQLGLLGYKSLLMLDSIVYTSLDTGSSKKPHVGAIVGGAVGGVLAVLIAAMIFLYLRRRKARNGQYAIGEVIPVFDGFNSSAGLSGAGPGAGADSRLPAMAAIGTGISKRQKMQQSQAHVVGGAKNSALPSTSATSTSRSSTIPQSSVNPTSTTSSGGEHDDALRERIRALETLVVRMHENGASAAANAGLEGDPEEGTAPPDYFSHSGDPEGGGNPSAPAGANGAAMPAGMAPRPNQEKGRPRVLVS